MAIAFALRYRSANIRRFTPALPAAHRRSPAQQPLCTAPPPAAIVRRCRTLSLFATPPSHRRPQQGRCRRHHHRCTRASPPAAAAAQRRKPPRHAPAHAASPNVRQFAATPVPGPLVEASAPARTPHRHSPASTSISFRSAATASTIAATPLPAPPLVSRSRRRHARTAYSRPAAALYHARTPPARLAHYTPLPHKRLLSLTRRYAALPRFAARWWWCRWCRPPPRWCRPAATPRFALGGKELAPRSPLCQFRWCGEREIAQYSRPPPPPLYAPLRFAANNAHNATPQA